MNNIELDFQNIKSFFLIIITWCLELLLLLLPDQPISQQFYSTTTIRKSDRYTLNKRYKKYSKTLKLSFNIQHFGYVTDDESLILLTNLIRLSKFEHTTNQIK